VLSNSEVTGRYEDFLLLTESAVDSHTDPTALAAAGNVLCEQVAMNVYLAILLAICSFCLAILIFPAVQMALRGDGELSECGADDSKIFPTSPTVESPFDIGSMVKDPSLLQQALIRTKDSSDARRKLLGDLDGLPGDQTYRILIYKESGISNVQRIAADVDEGTQDWLWKNYPDLWEAYSLTGKFGPGRPVTPA
jgi:hypothetical protein